MLLASQERLGTLTSHIIPDKKKGHKFQSNPLSISTPHHYHHHHHFMQFKLLTRQQTAMRKKDAGKDKFKKKKKVNCKPIIK